MGKGGAFCSLKTSGPCRHVEEVVKDRNSPYPQACRKQGMSMHTLYLHVGLIQIWWGFTFGLLTGITVRTRISEHTPTSLELCCKHSHAFAESSVWSFNAERSSKPSYCDACTDKMTFSGVIESRGGALVGPAAWESLQSQHTGLLNSTPYLCLFLSSSSHAHANIFRGFTWGFAGRGNYRGWESWV